MYLNIYGEAEDYSLDSSPTRKEVTDFAESAAKESFAKHEAIDEASFETKVLSYSVFANLIHDQI